MGKQAWFRIHSFTGVITGLVLFVICWSGTFAVVSKELDLLVTPEAQVKVGEEKASWGEIEDAVKKAHPDAEVMFIEGPLYASAAAQVVANMPNQRVVRFYVNPYTLEVQDQRSFFNIWRFFAVFHFNFFLSDFGDYFVTAFSITLMASLVSALIFYKRWWRRFLKWPSGKGRAFWSDLHKVGGLWSLWFVLVIGVTGVWYLFEHVYVAAGGSANYVGESPYGVVQVPASAADPLPNPLSLGEAVAIAQADWPQLNIRLVAYGWYSDRSDVIYIEGRNEFSLVRERANQMHVDLTTGEILWRNDASDLPAYWVWSNMADPLHLGNFGGLWSKSLYFIFGLILCGLILSGTWLHAHRLARDTGGEGRHRWTGTRTAILGALLIFSVSTWFGMRHAYNLGPIEEGVQQFPDIAPGVIAVIGVWVGLTLAIIAAWAILLWRPQLVLRHNAVTGAAKSASWI